MNNSKLLFFLVFVFSFFPCYAIEIYPLSFGYSNVEECNSLGEVVTKYKYSTKNKITIKKATGLIQGEWILEEGLMKGEYYIYNQKEIGKNEYTVAALVKYDKKGRIVEKISFVHDEGQGKYVYNYSINGLLTEAVYFPRVPLDEPPIIIRSVIEQNGKTLTIKYMYDDNHIKFIERYYN